MNRKRSDSHGWTIARVCACLLLLCQIAHSISAQDKSGVADGSSKTNASLVLKDLNGHFPFSPPSSLEEWNRRAEQVRLQLKVSLGLWPMPKLDPVRPSIHGKMVLDGYTIEKVAFESLPGLYVTGNLYRPTNRPEGKKLPGVLCPHGHWLNARFYDESPKKVKQLLATGAERFEMAARNHIQARCVQLARMGCVVFHWDMLGYCDSKQISFERAHRFASQPRESEVKGDGWLLYSPLAESHNQSIMGLQSLAALRGIDFLSALPDVDASRLAITGASGGGTQSFITAAIDPRIAVAFPAVMVSTGMQGGCTCENCSGLRVETGNIEIAGLIAPRPLRLTSANDWTKTMAEDGFPQLQALYQLFGAKDKVALFPGLHFEHNYNHVARTSMYGWINKHFELGFEEPVLEREFDLKLAKDLTVWDSEHPQPPGGEDFERRLMKQWSENIDAQLEGWLNGGQAERDRLRGVLVSGWRVCLGLTTPSTRIVEWPTLGQEAPEWTFQSAAVGTWKVRRLTNDLGAASKATALWVDSDGNVDKQAVKTLADSGVDVYLLIETDLPSKEQALVANPRLAAAYTFGYNMPQFARKARQVGLALTWMQRNLGKFKIIAVGQGADGAVAAGGVFAFENSSDWKVTINGETPSLAIDGQGFAFSSAESIRDPNFLPGASRYWDLPGLVGCCSGKVLLATSDGNSTWKKTAALLKERGESSSIPAENRTVSLAKMIADWSKAR